MIPNFQCPNCNFKLPGAYVIGERTYEGAFMHYACKNTKCLKVWRVKLIEEEENE